MTIIAFLVQLAGATMLLLYAVRMVRTGIERAFGASFQRIVTTTGNPLSAAGTGLVLAVILQSSAAVGLLVAGFAASGALGFASGLAVVLGADLGSALLIQVLSFDMDWLVPLLLAIGGGAFMKSDRRSMKQAGRIILGIAFILISLRFLRETMEPIRDSAFLPALAGYLERDFITAFLTGAVLAWVMHSSVAVILMCVTLVAIGAIPETVGVSLVLGANLGSALIPIWLTRGMSAVARRVPLANFILRGSGAIAVLVVFNKMPVAGYIDAADPAQTLINVHVLFNLALLITLPFCGLLLRPVSILLPDPPPPVGDEAASRFNRSVLDETSLGYPHLAMACLKREVLRMAQVVETMIQPVMGFYQGYDRSRAGELIARDTVVNDALDGVRRYVAAMPVERMSKEDRKQARDLAEYAIEIEAAGDIVVKILLPLAREKSESRIRFSEAGAQELTAMHERVLANMAMAFNVLISDEVDSARLLLEEKNEMTRRERNSRKKHFKRLGEGASLSFESSDIHIETLRALREFNSHIASVAYPILYRRGQLLETRLIRDMKEERSEG